MLRGARTLIAALALALIGAAPASAKQFTLSAAETADRDCTTSAPAAGPAVATQTLRAPYTAAITAGLAGGTGDWDLAVVDPRSGRVVAGSASRGADELAQGYVTEGERLVVKACRRSGASAATELTVAFTRVATGEAPAVQLVNVATPDAASERRLLSLGLDLAEHSGPGYITAVLHGPRDAARLRAAGLGFDVVVADLVASDARDRATDNRLSRAIETSSLPSGRTTYRRLFDYSEEMKTLAENNPDLVRPLTLPLKTYEGRTVEGIEITENAGERRDGKPVFVMLGVHHAREWPSGEHAIEWAYELIKGYKSDDARIKRLLRSTRTIIVPIVNPDGFNTSREAGELLGAGGGRGGNDTLNIATSPNEYRRKNCRLLSDAASGSCLQASVGLREPGVDPNRNYGGFWGGPGAGTDPLAQDYRGPAPFSEPESENIRQLISGRQVVTMITNHTFSDLVLRPPGIAAQGDPFDETVYKALGDAMAAQNGYTSQKGFELYDTTGTTEDWSYFATGGLGFTFEIGCNTEPALPIDSGCVGNFHPPYADVIAEYEGTSARAQAVGGKGNREAYLIAQESTANADRHSVLVGDAPPGAVLKLEKRFQTATSPQADGQPIMLDDHLTSELKIGDAGEYRWDINPSTRPLVAKAAGREAQGPPSPAIAFSGDASGATPCADFETDDPSCWNDHPFTIPGGAGVDNDSATVSINWTSPVSDWDMKVFRDVDGDGTSETETAADEVGQSGTSPPSTTESTTFIQPEAADGRLAPGNYVVRVVNYASADPYTGEVEFAGPGAFSPATTESWTLTCSVDGNVGSSEEVKIARGERKRIDLRQACVRGLDLSCAGQRATVAGTKDADSLRGTKGNDVIAAEGGRDRINGRGGNDLICGAAGKDKIKGAGGRDRLKGQGGGDRLRGGGGKDRLGGGKARDRLNGGGGKDRCSGGPGRDRKRHC